MIDRFQHDPPKVPTYDSLTQSRWRHLNLTRANHVFHFDRGGIQRWKIKPLIVFRIGQPRTVNLSALGLWKKKLTKIESKKALAEQVVGAGEQWLTELWIQINSTYYCLTAML